METVGPQFWAVCGRGSGRGFLLKQTSGCGMWQIEILMNSQR